MKNRRQRTRLIKPELQTQAIFVSLFFALLAVVLATGAIYFMLPGELKNDSDSSTRVARAFAIGAGIAILVLGPLVLAYVAYATHRVAGPAFRMEQYLKAYLRGEEQGRLTLREKDELQVLANLLDMALAKKERPDAEGGNTAKSEREKKRVESLPETPTEVPEGIALDPDSIPTLLPKDEARPKRNDSSDFAS